MTLLTKKDIDRLDRIQEEGDGLGISFLRARGVQRRELARYILGKMHGWMTIAYLYQDYQPSRIKDGDGFRPPQITIVRYRNKEGKGWKKWSHFNLSLKLAEICSRLFPEWIDRADELVALVDAPEPPDPEIGGPAGGPTEQTEHD